MQNKHGKNEYDRCMIRKEEVAQSLKGHLSKRLAIHYKQFVLIFDAYIKFTIKANTIIELLITT